MPVRVLLLAAAALALAAVTVLALLEGGLMGIIRPHFQTWGGAQVLLDLVILAVLSCVWMVRDARSRGRTAWPFVLLTLAAGSFGPLAYLLTRRRAAP